MSPEDSEREIRAGETMPRVFRSRRLNRFPAELDFGTPDGTEQGWAHNAMLAWQRHYAAVKKVRGAWAAN